MRHLSSITTSKRLQRLMDAMADGAWHTTLELQSKAFLTNPSGAISELRANGLHIQGENLGRNENGSMVYRYKWSAGQLEMAL
jgi:hypothetical protein